MSDDRELKLNSVGFSLPWSSREFASKALAEESAKRADEYCRVSDEFSSLNFVVMCRRLANFQVACMEGRQSPMDLKVQAWVAYMKDMQEKKQAGKSCELSDAMEYSLFRLGMDTPSRKKCRLRLWMGQFIKREYPFSPNTPCLLPRKSGVSCLMSSLPFNKAMDTFWCR